MARSHRCDVGGTVYHVLNRGANRRQIFDDRHDYAALIRLLWTAAAVTGMRVLAYCVMPNHWHLILWPLHDRALATFLRRLTWSHALYYRRRSKTVGEGHVYQAPYRCFPLQTEQYYYNALRYVEANPLRAGLVTKAEEWRWSSIRWRAEPHGHRLADGPLQLPGDWVDLVNQALSNKDLRLLRECAQTGRPYGADEWANQVAVTHGLEHTFRKAGRPPRPRRQWFC